MYLKLKIYMCFFFMYFGPTPCLYSNNFIDNIIQKNNQNFDKIKSFQSELIISAQVDTNEFVKKGTIYYHAEQVKNLRLEFYYPAIEISIYSNGKLVYQKGGEVINEESTPTTNCPTCQSNENNEMVTYSVFNEDIVNYNVVSIASNATEYIITGIPKNFNQDITNKIFILDKVSGLLKKSTVYVRGNFEIRETTIQYDKINGIWIYNEIKDESFFKPINKSAVSSMLFKSIKVNEPVKDSVFRY